MIAGKRINNQCDERPSGFTSAEGMNCPRDNLSMDRLVFELPDALTPAGAKMGVIIHTTSRLNKTIAIHSISEHNVGIRRRRGGVVGRIIQAHESDKKRKHLQSRKRLDFPQGWPAI